MKVLVVEDDLVLREGLGRALRAEGYAVELAEDGEAGLALSRKAEVVLLDLMLPKTDGWTVMREMRNRGSRAMVLMLTALDDLDDRVKGLDLGADDYLPKPFDVPELLARVRALARRAEQIAPEPEEKTYQAGPIQVFPLNKRVEVDGVEVALTPREYSLLEAMVRNSGRTLTHDVIARRVWDVEASPNAVAFHVTSLRRKLSSVGSGAAGALVRTVHGFGYALKLDHA